MTRSIDAPIGGTRRRAAMSYEERCTREWLEGKGLRPEEEILMEVEPAPARAAPRRATNGQAPPDPWEGGERPQCVQFKDGGYEVRVQSKYVGFYPKLADAIQARDAYRAANPPKRGRPKAAPKPTALAASNGTAPPLSRTATPDPPASSPAQLRVGDVATLRSGGELMTVVGLGPDGVDLMTWSAGELKRLCLPRECVTKGE